MKPIGIFAAGLLVAATGTGTAVVPAWAADVTAPSRIAQVEVYPDGATVAREATAAVPAGESVIVLENLPLSLDPDSVRVEAEATAGLEIVSVDMRRMVPKPHDEPGEIGARIEALQRERQAVEDAIATANEQIRFVRNIVSEAPKQMFDLKGERPAPDWSDMLGKFGTSLSSLRETVRASTVRLQEIKDEIARLRDKQNESFPEAKPTYQARISVVADKPADAALTLRYAAAGAVWRPVYDARLSLSGERPSLDLVRRAVVTQATGEDWSDAELTLSTARPGGRAEAPELSPLIVRIAPQPRPVPMAQSRKTMRMFDDNEMAEAAPMEAPAGGAMVRAMPARERAAALETRGFDLVYRIPGRTSIVGDGTPKTLKIGSDTISPELIVRSVPVLDPTAYLTVRFDNESAGPILPGEVQLFRDGVFVGKGGIGFIAPNEEVSFGFGADPAVVVERITLEKSEGERGMLSTDKIDQRRYRITVTNRHDRTMRMEIDDRLPQSENEKIEVERASDTTEPTTTDVDGRRGVVRWAFDLDAGKAREILIGYTVRWPEEERIMWNGGPVR
ncbi:uncharacterized protein (TIGR02231 family) [Rhodobium orientis]|uniref:DUF4139 domain-containing protein n=1 Tax=Rhodobium orientis TaxID=34017 RepID=A0A327JSA9_9HYPH|nr:mucoidy inhibitor MuiA family protein [Rhodobium orientis]MBB4303033.1 uncharacterized protein (TIGR02231 family) [Rhodobium orientis]MBK5949592.1 hypothetical protein [Rhodobium orientis]RAI29379.1 hypothetical protein CH339_03595 [Rhodobium orientis]